jgi:hypothetical protein
MLTQAIKIDNGWYIPNSLGLDTLNENVIDLNVELVVNQSGSYDYKQLHGLDVMERYQEKRAREVELKVDPNLEDLLQEKLNLSNLNFSNALRML